MFWRTRDTILPHKYTCNSFRDTEEFFVRYSLCVCTLNLNLGRQSFVVPTRRHGSGGLFSSGSKNWSQNGTKFSRWKRRRRRRWRHLTFSHPVSIVSSLSPLVGRLIQGPLSWWWDSRYRCGTTHKGPPVPISIWNDDTKNYIKCFPLKTRPGCQVASV